MWKPKLFKQAQFNKEALEIANRIGKEGTAEYDTFNATCKEICQYISPIKDQDTLTKQLIIAGMVLQKRVEAEEEKRKKKESEKCCENF